MMYKTYITPWLKIKCLNMIKMIIGKKSTLLKSNQLTINCPKCGQSNTITLKVLGDYGHLFQIPFVSKGKRGESECANCREVIAHQEMKSDLKLAYFELKENVKTPIWFYSGLIAIKVLVIYKIIFINP